jgi:Mg/Co/Ni transporter MgtE
MFVYVVDDDGRLLGWADRAAVERGVPIEEATTLVGPDASVPADATLKEALSAMLALGFRSVAVVDDGRRLLGEVGFDEIEGVLSGSAARGGGGGPA